MSPSFIWFRLVDNNGQPYKGTSATKVSFSSSPDVDDFRDAVYLKNSPILTGITSSQLTVYINKAAFDKESPLDPTESISTFENKQDMLIVVVPSSIRTFSGISKLK
jgi:hypothetical protein